MNVFYEEGGHFKVGSVVSKLDASYQVDTQYGKRIKLKAHDVLLEFSSPLNDFLPAAEGLLNDLDVDFLWECCGEAEFNYKDLAAEYWGHPPSAIEYAAIIMRLFTSPIYFYKKGKGNYKAAPPESLKAAIASIERKKREQEQVEAWVTELLAGRLPEPVALCLITLLFRPDKNSLEYKAFEQASRSMNLSLLQLAIKLGGIPSVPDYLLAGFLLEFFPQGRGFRPYELPHTVDTLPLAEVAAFSIDDAETTEIDDAFSLISLPNGNKRVGVHIAAPTLGIPEGSVLEQIVYTRLSTVYYPGGKITMLPEDVIDIFTLKEGYACPALSLYIEVTPSFELQGFENRIERVPIAANLRHGALEPLFNEATLAHDPGIEYPFKQELTWLWQFATELEKRRGKIEASRPLQLDYSFCVVDGIVDIKPRQRGTPMDKLVSELMILANCEWGRQLAASGEPGLYRVQTTGKVRMATRPEPHSGLGVPQYVWATSPLRRAADFVNQRQLIAMVQGLSFPFTHGDVKILSILRDFDTTYSAYLAFQDRMEYFWCLRWLNQHNLKEITATYLKEDLVRLDNLPLRLRVAGLPPLNARDRLQLAITRIDEISLVIECRFLAKLDPQSESENLLTIL